MNSIASTQPSQQNDAAFAFVQELAQGLSRREIELPSFPDVAIRVRKILSDDDVTAQDIVRVVGSEPALAARIMQMANSAALGHVGKPIADLRAAITRIGFNLVRSAAIAFAMSQLRRSEDLKPQHSAPWWRVAIRRSTATRPCSQACCTASASCTS
jgi:HD-like signal output (HDOD) protein